MTKLVLVLAVVVVVILVVVIVAVKNMRAEDPEEFAGQDERDARYGRRRPDRQPVGASRSAGPTARAASGRQGREPRPGSADRSFDERRDQQRGRGYGHRSAEDQGYDSEQGYADQGYDSDRGFSQRAAGALDDLRGATAATSQERRRRSDSGLGHRSDEAPARARPARGRRSEDSSEWDSSEWEKLSDVDYWAELASDKPLTTTAQPAAPHSAATRNGAQRRAGQDRKPETLAVPGPVPGAPRRDPATGLPVRGPQQPADADLAATAGRNDFAAAPVTVDRAQDRQRPATGPNRERRRQDPQRPAASASGERSTRRPRPRAASTGERRLSDRLAAAPVSESEQRSLDALIGDPSTYLSAGPASLPMPAIRDVPRDRSPRERPRLAPDDDPLTSPSFPKIPAADSRSYHSGRTDTPANGSRAQSPYSAPTQQFAAYDTPAAPYYPSPQRAERPAAQYPAAAPYPSAQRPERPAEQYPAPERATRPRGNGSADGDRSNPYAYRPDPLTSPGRYSAGAAAASTPPAPVPPAAGNPYGSYVTPDSQPTMASSYDSYSARPGNGHGQSYLPPAVPGDTGQTRNGYWHQQPSAPPNSADRSNAAGAPDADPYGAGYRNGYGQHDQAGYLPASYPASQNDPAGYAPVDPYRSDGYGGYPEYGAAER